MNDTLVISSIGYKSFKVVINEFENGSDIFLEEDVASLDEVVIVADPRPTTGNGIVQKAIEKLPKNLPEAALSAKRIFTPQRAQQKRIQMAY